MDESNTSNTSQGGQPSPSGPKEVMTNDQLQIKCRSLLNIAQKAKQAKNEAVEKNNFLTEENKKLIEKFSKLQKDYGVTNEMLATLTDQKLKLAMQIDDFKKENKKINEELQKVKSSYEKLEAENLNLKRQYSRIISDNEILTGKLEETELKLRDAITLQSDINQLQQNNENIKLLCSNVTQEKLELKNECGVLKEKIFILEKEKERFSQYLSKVLDVNDVDIDEWIKRIDNLIKSKEVKCKSDPKIESDMLLEKEKNEKLNSELTDLRNSLKDVTSERDSIQEEFDLCNDKLKQTMEELRSISLDHEKMMENLEKMRVETRQLIENSEKLSEDMESLKMEKSKVERELGAQLEDKDRIIKEMGSKLSNKDNCAENIELESKLKSIEQDLEMKCCETQKLNSLLEEEISKRNGINLEFDQLKKEYKDLESNTLNCNNELREALETLENTKKELNLSRTELKDSNELISTLEKQKIDFEKELNDLTSTLTQKEKVIINLSKELELKASNCGVTEETELLLQKLKDENVGLQEKLLEIQSEFSTKETSYLESVAASNEEIGKLKSKCDHVERELKTLEEKSKVESEERAAFTQKLNAASEQLNLLCTENQKLKSDNKKFQDELTEIKCCYEQCLNKNKSLEENINVMIREKEVNTDKILELETVITEKTNQYCQLSKEFEDIKKGGIAYESELQEISAELKKTREILSDRESLNEKLKIELSTISDRFAELESENSSLIESLKNQKESCESLEKSLSEGTHERDKLNENLKIEILGLSDQLAKLESENSSLRASLEREEKSCESLKNSLEQDSQEKEQLNENLKIEISGLSDQLTKLESENASLKASLEKEQKSCESLKKSLEEGSKERELLNEKQVKELNNHIDTLSFTCSDLQRTISELNEAVKQKTSEVEDKSETILSLEREIESLRTSVSNLQSSLQLKEAESAELKGSLDQLKKEEGRFCNLEESTNRMSQEIAHLKEMLNLKTANLEESRRNWLGQLTILKGAFLGIKHSYDDIKRNMYELQQFSQIFFPLVPKNIQEKIANCVEYTLNSNKQDLLSEMQQMNQALKERGEVIANLNESLLDAQQKLKQKTDSLKCLEEELSSQCAALDEKEKQLKFKDIFIKDLEAEMSRLRETSESNPDGDVMSTSTISRVDESTMLKDVEDSFEERYTKLKILAVKLKKRVSELKTALEHEKAKSSEERNDFNEKIHSLTTAAKNAQILQDSFDKMTDAYEEEKKKCKSLEANLQLSNEKVKTLETEISKLEAELTKIPSLNSTIEMLESNLKSAKKELSMVQKEKEVEAMKYTELKKDSSKLETKVAELSAALEQVRHKTRNSNMLELEMKNYEKTIDDLSSQVVFEKDRVKHLQDEVDSYNSVKSGLEEQISLLESQIKIEEERNLTLTNQISKMKSVTEDMQNQLSDATGLNESLESELQGEKSKRESLAVECASLSADFTAREKEMESQISSLQRMVSSLEVKLKASEEDCSIAQSEVERVQKEFESYRLRAQSVLAKQKSDVVTQGEREAREQIEKLNAEKEKLNHSLDQILSEMEIVKTEASSSLHEKQRIEKKLDEVTKHLQQKTLELDKACSEFRSYKISTETLKQCYKNELEEKEKNFKQELDTCRNQLEEMSQKLKSMEESENILNSNDETSPPQFTENSMESPPLEREDAEGSESVPSPVVRKYSNLIPLDVLLNTPYDSEARVNVLVERISSLEKELSALEITSKHLASLLSEAEKDSARNAHLNSVLKEEVRRLERSLQRQPHVTNTEYLKNVIFKFVTLQSGDERSRLVPVLDTILKLSPEENHKLAEVARGEMNSSWGSYLPTWK